MRNWITGIAAAAGALAAGPMIAGSAPGWGGDLPGPPTAATDPIRSAPFTPQHRPDCGVSASTLDQLVPDAVRRRPFWGETCEWSAWDDRKGRRLTVTITVATGTVQPTFGRPGATPITSAMDTFSRQLGDQNQRGTGEVKAVTGLGDEASAFYSASEAVGGGTVIGRIRNVVVRVRYGGRSEISSRQLPEPAAMPGALRAATEVVRGLGIPVNRAPAYAPPSADTRERPQPRRDPCSLVRRQTVENVLGQEAEREDGEAPGAIPRAPGTPGSTATCRWTLDPDEGNHSYDLNVRLDTHPSVAAATRAYVIQYLRARAEEPISKHDEKYFAAVTGLGDQAYAAFVAEGQPGGVAFRMANALVTVSYSQDAVSNVPAGGAGPLTREQSVNGAYAAALDAARALRG
jgi:hypothetical protein